MGTLSQKNKPAKPERSSLSVSLKSEEPGALIKHLQKLSPKRVIDVQHRKRDLQDQLTILDKKEKEYANSELADKDRILNGIAHERQQIQATLQELPAYYKLHTLKQQDEDTLIQDIMELLLWTDEQLSLNNKMSEKQVVNCAYMVAEEFTGMYLEDIGIALKQGISGHFGELYRIDTNTVLNWLRKYRKEKADLIKEQNESRHASSKGDALADRNSKTLDMAELSRQREEQAQANEAKGSE